jgi:hypothetical protein
MARRQFDIRLRDQIDERALAGRRMSVHRFDHLFVLMRARHRQNLRMGSADRIGFFAHAAGYNHAAIFGNRLANRGKAFFLRAIQKPAGIDQHHISARIILGKGISIGAQARKDAFGIDKRLGAAKADHPYFLLVWNRGAGDAHSGARLHGVSASR